MWLWAVGPLVILAAATWLAVVTRRLDRAGGELVTERPSTAARRASLHESLAGLRDDIAAFGPGRSPDSDAGTADR